MALRTIPIRRSGNRDNLFMGGDRELVMFSGLLAFALVFSAQELRASVAGGGCSGLSYKLDFDNEVRPMDQEFEDKGVRVVVDMKSFLYLAGTELDFSDGLNGKGFQFNNPNASRECGCGESFSV